MLRRLSALPLLALLTVGCGSDDPPRVTFGAGQDTVQAGPTQYCNLEFTDCHNDANAPVQLAVAPGTPLRVELPGVVSDTPWQVVFTYRDATGAQADGRTPVFAAGAREDYDLQLPAPTDRLLTAQVQQYGPPPESDPETGEIRFPIRASWVVNNAG